MKKVLWGAMLAGVTALASGLAFRLSVKAWRAFMKEEPPEMPRWVRMLVAAPMRKGVLAGLHAPAP